MKYAEINDVHFRNCAYLIYPNRLNMILSKNLLLKYQCSIYKLVLNRTGTGSLVVILDIALHLICIKSSVAIIVQQESIALTPCLLKV